MSLQTRIAALITAIGSDIKALYAHASSAANPHTVTKAQVGLGSVDNTSDAEKNAATATLRNKTLIGPVIEGGQFTSVESSGPIGILAPIYSEPSLDHDSAALLSLRSSGHVQLATSVSVQAPYAVSMQVKHSNIDGMALPLHINPLGGEVMVGSTGLSTLGQCSSESGFVLQETGIGLSTKWITGGYAAKSNSGYGARIGFESWAVNRSSADIVFEAANGVGNFVSMGRLSLYGLSVAGAINTAGIHEDTSGNVGLGVVPSPWYPGSGYKGIDIGTYAAVAQDGPTGGAVLASNAYGSLYNQWIYKNSNAAAKLVVAPGSFDFYYAPPGTAGDLVNFIKGMELTYTGNFLVGATNRNYHGIYKPPATSSDAGVVVFESARDGSAGLAVWATSGLYGNAANSTVKVGHDAVTNRSINAGGTINASGADYAEYERNNGFSFSKGDIVCFKADGTLTDIFSEAIRFGVKSTNPSYVGGDTWGTEDVVGKRPEQPVYLPPAYDGTPNPGVAPTAPIFTDRSDAESDADFATRKDAFDAIFAAYLDAYSVWSAEYAAWQIDDDKHKARVIAAQSAHDAAVARYESDLPIFAAKLEAARQRVDRIAYSGKVPCNVLGAIPGGYIIATVGEGGKIKGEFVADPDFAQYKIAIGRVNRILDDGRCEVAVIVH